VKELSDPKAKKQIILTDLEKQKPMGFKNAFFKMAIKSNLDFQFLEENFIVEEKTVSDYKSPKMGGDELKPEDYKNYNLLTYPFVINYNQIEDFSE